MYNPQPIDTSDVVLSEEISELCETLAANVHDVWAKSRIEEGWVYGDVKDSENLTTPCMVPYADLPESEKEYDRNTVMETLKVIEKLGYDIQKKA